MALGEVQLQDVLGQGGNGIVYSGKILNEIIAIKFLISDGSGNTLKSKINRFLAEYFNVITLDESKGIVKYIDYDVLKFIIKEIWIHYDNSVFNDFLLLHFESSEPFIEGNNKLYYAAFVDDKYQISHSEYENGYAEVDGEIVQLSNHKVEFIERQNEDGYLFIGTKYHCILGRKNDKNVINFIQRLKDKDGKLDIEEFKEFEREIRHNILPEILERL